MQWSKIPEFMQEMPQNFDTQYDNPIELPRGTVLHGKSYDYVVESKLGQGSFGITYLVKVRMKGELGALDTKVQMVVKEFFMDSINGRKDTTVITGSNKTVFEKYKEKFVNEAINISKLKHPNIIKVIENFSQNNTVYYAMEFIPGGSLNSVILKNGRLSQEQTILYAKQICLALELMHANGMIHLDLKPSNIMMDGEKLVLIDFGLSKQYDDDGNPETSTSIGGGTTGYAPLEQFNYKPGDGLPVTMDIYALGGTMFKMLTGKTPPEASTILNDGFPIKDFDHTDCSLELLTVITKCMAPLKKDRYKSVKDVFKALEQVPAKNIETHKRHEKGHKGENFQDNGKDSSLRSDDTRLNDFSLGEKVKSEEDSPKPLPFPKGIHIRLDRRDDKGYSYEFFLRDGTFDKAQGANYVKIWKDGVLVNEHSFGENIPKDVKDFLISNNYLTTEHWEYNSTPDQSAPKTQYNMEIGMFWEDGYQFKRSIQCLGDGQRYKLLDDIQYLIECSSLNREVAFVRANNSHPYDMFLKYENGKGVNNEPTLGLVKVLPGTDLIRVTYHPQSPCFTGEYAMLIYEHKLLLTSIIEFVFPNKMIGKEAKPKLDSSIAVELQLTDELKLDLERYFNSLAFTSQPRNYNHEYSEEPALFNVTLSKEGETYASYTSRYICGEHFGDLVGNPKDLNLRLQSLIPGFDKMLVEAEEKKKAFINRENSEAEGKKEKKDTGDQTKSSKKGVFLVLTLIVALLATPVYIHGNFSASKSVYFFISLLMMEIGAAFVSFNSLDSKKGSMGLNFMLLFGALYVILWISEWLFN